MLDAQAGRDYFSSDAQARDSIAYAGSAFAWGGGRLADSWPAASDEDAYRRVRTSTVETLLIGGEVDTSTPPQNATKQLLPYLPNGHQVILPALGHTASFFAEQPEAGSRLINTFFDSGEVDQSLYQQQSVDFTPERTLTALAKIASGVMIGLALLAVLALLWMAFWVHRRGRFGRRTSVTLRAVSPVVLGVGGWLLGVLVVLTMMPGVPLDSAVLAVLAVGVPVGLGLYFAWVNRDWMARTRAAGFAAAIGAGLVGAWLGFNATEGFVALASTIAGAAVAGNLALLVLDTVRDRRARDRVIDTTAKEMVAARTGTGS
jgi:hypothetical protein